jgi:glycosyltransferase involved in cell wall biosynthesis
VPEKGLDTLLAAWAQARRPPGWRLRLVGEGPLRAALEAQARALGIAASVELPGQSERVEEDLAGADLGVLPSRFEGLSNTLLEGMAAGLPMLASRISGNEDFVVPGRNGWLFEPGDVTGLAAVLSAAMALPAAARQAMGEAARADVLAKASVPAVIGQLLPLYRGAKA